MSKKIFAFLMTLGIFFTLGNNFAAAQGKILVAYFSRVGNEYGVGNIQKGNTKIIAEIIAEKTGGDLFEIKTVTPYPADYDACTKIASREKATKARPELVGTVENFSEYDTIFLGYPIWYGDAPMAIYTFLESYVFFGKNLVPFCTHGGSGLSSTDQQFALVCPDAKILPGFEIRGTVAQKNFSEAEQKVSLWLKKNNLNLE